MLGWVTCRPNTTTGTLEEGRMIARSYRALFWTHTQALHAHDRNIATGERCLHFLQQFAKHS